MARNVQSMGMSKKIQTASLQQMREALSKEMGSKFPIKITRVDGEQIVRYMRGFADAQNNILLVSESSFSLALKILELKEIQSIEYGEENSGGVWKVIHAKWNRKSLKL
jgi:hypothetical protein